jgi:hypothetical protein
MSLEVWVRNIYPLGSLHRGTQPVRHASLQYASGVKTSATVYWIGNATSLYRPPHTILACFFSGGRYGSTLDEHRASLLTLGARWRRKGPPKGERGPLVGVEAGPPMSKKEGRGRTCHCQIRPPRLRPRPLLQR